LVQPNHQRVLEIFQAAVDLPREQRGRILEQECRADAALRAEVEDLLRRDDAGAGSFLEVPRLGPDFSIVTAAEPDPLTSRLVGARIGQYELTRVIASGGMGIVCEAEQRHPRRTVAVKVLRRALATRSALDRFEYESSILARLRHPGIAEIHEAGTHVDEATGDRVPYFVMALVPAARPLTTYAREEGLDVEARLRLFVRVCQAVHYGHQRSVIHRDLKPANILVDAAGDPRIIDFGVARATDSDVTLTTMHTGVGQLIGTLQYMSPEQCAADPDDVDTRGDVYALGVVLYELLCGSLPYDLRGLELPESLSVIRTAAPARPSSVDRRLRGDLETIVLRALEKDRDRRYQSALDLGQDIERFLARDTILARPPSALYQMRKFAERHRALVGAAAVVVIVLAIASVVSSSLAMHAREAEARSRSVASFLIDSLLAAERNPTGFDIDVRRIDRMLEETTLDDPAVEAQLRIALAPRLRHPEIMMHDRAEAHLLRALELRRSRFGEVSPEVYETLKRLSRHHQSTGDVAKARELADRAVTMRATLHGADHWATHYDEELYGLVLYSIADEAEFRRRRLELHALRGSVPLMEDVQGVLGPAGSMDLICADDFDGDELDAAWTVETRNVRSWSHELAEAGLRVTDIVAERENAGSGGEISSVRLLRHLGSVGDFSISAEIGWDNADELGVVQWIGVGAIDVHGGWIVNTLYDDGTAYWLGATAVELCGAPAVRTPYDTLPGRGAARIDLQRRDGRVVVFWNRDPIAVTECAEPVASLVISVATYPGTADGIPMTSGVALIDRVRVEGLASRERLGVRPSPGRE
jgi:serine/threonine protein kinase